jgi:hypothetical protein
MGTFYDFVRFVPLDDLRDGFSFQIFLQTQRISASRKTFDMSDEAEIE